MIVKDQYKLPLAKENYFLEKLSSSKFKYKMMLNVQVLFDSFHIFQNLNK